MLEARVKHIQFVKQNGFVGDFIPVGGIVYVADNMDDIMQENNKNTSKHETLKFKQKTIWCHRCCCFFNQVGQTLKKKLDFRKKLKRTLIHGKSE
jgi:hypothetical protein